MGERHAVIASDGHDRVAQLIRLFQAPDRLVG
jgi:hypothetical protein